MNSGHDFKAGRLRSVNVSKMHKAANLHIHEALKSSVPADNSSNTHTSTQISVTESPPSTDEDGAVGDAVGVRIRQPLGKKYAAHSGARGASNMNPHTRDLSTILGAHQTIQSRQSAEEDVEESLESL